MSRECDCLRTDLYRTYNSSRVRGLSRIPSLHASSATPASTVVDHELPRGRFDRWNVDLVLSGRPCQLDFASTVRADQRTTNLYGLVNISWNRSTRLRPYPLPPLRPGFFGLSFGLPFENGPACRLPARRDSSSASRRALFSPRNVAISSPSVAFSLSSSITRLDSRATSPHSSSIAPTTPLTLSIATQFRPNLKSVNRYNRFSR